MDLDDLFRTVGSLAGFIALLWRAFDEFVSYLRISVEVSDPDDDWVTILSTVDNRGSRSKSPSKIIPSPDKGFVTSCALMPIAGTRVRFG